MVQKKEIESLHVRVPSTLKQLMQKYVELDYHINISDFTRDALKEKLKRDAPHLYKEVFKENQK
jgi:Arc/MetJ-type ribon-helix-helix transcriptional regulator